MTKLLTEAPPLIPPKKFELIHGDCMDRLYDIEEKSVDMILCDLPYGITACKWDSIIPFEPLWAHYKRIIKDNGAIVLFGAQPFTSALVMSNPKWFRYEWIYIKTSPSGFLNSRKMPLREHENILVFYKKLPTYNPQMQERSALGKKNVGKLSTHTSTGTEVYRETLVPIRNMVLPNRLPGSTQKFTNHNAGKRYHPTQKPLPLCEYLIKTYTNEGDLVLVLDNCMGSGTTGVACVNTNRRFVGMEKEEKYFDIACRRIRGVE